MGIGEDWNEDLLEQVAAQSGGRSVYIQSPEKVQVALREMMQNLTGTFIQNLRLWVDCATDVALENVFRVSPHLQDFPSADEGVLLGSLQADVPVTVILELNVGHKPRGEHRLLTLSLTMDVPARHLQGYTLKRDVSSVFKPIDLENAIVPRRIINALGKFTLYRIQERAWRALDCGDVQMATDQLKVVSTRLFDLGEKELARATLLEAERIANGAAPLAKQRKAIRYGTRSLAITSGGGVQPETFYD
jgi:Ca-activated chloride channel family protein